MKNELLLGVDFGDARTGLALSDPTGLLATGAGCIRQSNLRKTAEETAAFAREKGAARIIVGNPRNMNGSEGPSVEMVREFGQQLAEAISIPIVYRDERLSTMAAERYLLEGDVSRKKRKKVIDKMAAVYILQGWLEKVVRDKGLRTRD